LAVVGIATCSFRFLTLWCFLGLKGLYPSVFCLFFVFFSSSFHTFKGKLSDIGYIFASRHPAVAASAAAPCPGTVRAAMGTDARASGCANIRQPNPVSLTQAELSPNGYLSKELVRGRTELGSEPVF